ncbi:MAG: hypothetical protein C0478_08900 [Planctomyces sp.]|nr:hypothetical protein [Planctomyces sp.]
MLDHAAPPNIPFGSGSAPATSRPSGELGPTAEASPSGIQPAGYSVAPVPRRVQTARPPVSRSWMFTN